MKITMTKTITLSNGNVVTTENAKDYVSFIGGIMVPDMTSSEPVCSGKGLVDDAVNTAKHDLLFEALDEAGYPEDGMTTVMSVKDLINVLADYNPKAFDEVAQERLTGKRNIPQPSESFRMSDCIADMAEFNS